MNYKSMTKKELLEVINDLESEVSYLSEVECQECGGFGLVEVEDLNGQIYDLEDENNGLQSKIEKLKIKNLKNKKVDTMQLESISYDLAHLSGRLDDVISKI